MTDREPDSAKKILDRLADFLWEEREGETTDDICGRLREDGIDPNRLQGRVGQLLERISEERRLQWMKAAREERERELSRLERIPIPSRNRQQIIAELKQRKQVAARNLDTTLEDMSDEQLRELYQETVWADRLGQDDEPAS